MAADVPNQSQTRWAYVAEATAGTTPNSPSMQVLRLRAGSSLKINRPRIESSELRNDRKLGSTFGGVGGAAARLPTLLFHETFQHDLLEAALFGAWAGDDLVDGITPKYKTFEQLMVAGTNNVFQRAAGALVNGFTLNVVPNQEATIDYDVLAINGSSASTAIAGATYANPSVGEAADYGDVSGISLWGLTSFSVLSLQLQVTNGLAGRPKLGTRDLKGLRMGNARIRFEAAIYLEDQAYLAAALANTEDQVAFTVGPIGGSAGARYTFTIPKCEIGDHDPSDNSGDGVLTLRGLAKYDSGIGAQLKIQKNQ
jgi:hypothetical protein